MADSDKKPLLMDELNAAEKVALANMSLHPGFQVLIKMFEAACTTATHDVIKLDPLVQDYERKLAYLQQAARTVNKYTELIRKSVIYHSEMAKYEPLDQEQVGPQVNEA